VEERDVQDEGVEDQPAGSGAERRFRLRDRTKEFLGRGFGIVGGIQPPRPRIKGEDSTQANVSQPPTD
jgi:hypothetical protein